MEAWSRFCTSFSSLPTTSPSSSPPSSSTSLDASLVLDVADDLWFYKSVISLPSLSVSCLPSLFTPSPDSSTLIAQCMITDFSPSAERERERSLVSSSSSSSSPHRNPDRKPLTPHPATLLTAYDSLPAPPSIQEIYANTFSEYDGAPYSDYESSYGGDDASSSSDRDEDMYRRFFQGGEDEEGYHYYSAPSDWDDEDAHHGYHLMSDSEDKEQLHPMKVEVARVDTLQCFAHNGPDDAFSGIYDLGAGRKDQHQGRTGSMVAHAGSQKGAAPRGYYPQRNRARSRSEQKELKENLKLWAHVVVSTLATRGRPLL